MTKKQKLKFLILCKTFGIEPNIKKYHEICYKAIVVMIHLTAEKERLHDGHYWLIDHWILEYNRHHGTDQSACIQDLKRGMAESDQDPVDFLYDRLQEIKKYRKKKWFKKGKDEYDDY